MLHSKSSEAIRCLDGKKRVKHKVLITENDPTLYLYLIQKHSRPVAWGNRSRDTQEPIAFHNQGWHKASLIHFFNSHTETVHRKSFTADGDGDCVYSSHKSIVLPRKTWNINTFWVNYDGSCICLLYLVFYWQMVGLGAGVGLHVLRPNWLHYFMYNPILFNCFKFHFKSISISF